MISRSRIRRSAYTSALVLTAWLFAPHIQAATMTASSELPARVGDDISNIPDLPPEIATGSDKWWVSSATAYGNPGMTVGQTFTTGNGAFLLTAVTFRVRDATSPTKTYTLRVGTVLGATFETIASETATQDFATAVDDYWTWTFDTPVLLSPNTLYGVDVGINSSTSDWKTGIPYVHYTSASTYADGTRFRSGTAGNGIGDDSISHTSGDRIFHLALERPLGETLELVATSPANGETEVLATRDLVLTFSQHIAPGAGHITLRNLTDATDTAVPADDARLRYEDNVLTLDANGLLDWSTEYAILIDAGAILGDGGAPFEGIADDSTWTFTTADGDPLLDALTELREHILGERTLTAGEIEAHKLTIDNLRNRFGESAAIIQAIRDLVETYEAELGVLFVDHGGFSNRETQVSDIHWTVYHVMQYAMDVTYNAATLAEHEALLTGFYYRGAERFPGWDWSIPVDPEASHTVSVSATFDRTFGRDTQQWTLPARNPTGTYLAPGTFATVTVPEHLVGKGFLVRVGCHSWDLTRRHMVRRMDRATIAYPIDQTTIRVGSPYGGGIYLEAPIGANEGVVEVTVTGAVRAPYFSAKSFHATTAQEWDTVERHHPAPWADFQSDRFMMQVPRTWIYNMTGAQAVALMADWDASMDAINDLMGFPRLRGKETMYLQPDRILRSSVHAPGYPAVNWQEHTPMEDTHGGYRNNYFVRGPAASLTAAHIEFHEQGHAYFFPKFGGNTEVEVNILHPAVQQRMFGRSWDEAHRSGVGSGSAFRTLDNTAVKWMTSFNFSPRNNPMAAGEKAYQMKGYAMFVEIARLFGWEALGDYYRSFMEYGTSGGNDDKQLRLARHVGWDTRPLLHFWGTHPGNPAWLANQIAAEGIPPSAEIYDLLVHYKSLVPPDNAAFQSFADRLWGRVPRPDAFWTETEHARQYDERNFWEDYNRTRMRQDIIGDDELHETYIEACAEQVRERVQEIIDLYFPDGRPGGRHPSVTALQANPAVTSVYGDTVSFTATASADSGTPSGAVEFRNGESVLGTELLIDGTATFVADRLPVGEYSIQAHYSGDSNFEDSASESVPHAVTPKSLSVTGVTAQDKVYDGTTAATLTGGTLSGVVGDDAVTVLPGSGAFANANAGTWAVTASGYALGGAEAGNYLLSAQPTVPAASITPRPIVLGGSRVYDGTDALADGALIVANRVEGDDLTLSGGVSLAGSDVGLQEVHVEAGGGAELGRLQSATGTTTTGSMTVTLGAAPTNGNTLVAVVSTRGTTAGRVTGITQTGATWARATQATNTSGSTTEIWYAPNVSGAASSLTINLAASLHAAAVVIEYSGVLADNPLDQIANAAGSGTAAVTGTTSVTTQADELWIGGIGFDDSRKSLGTPLNSFREIATSASSGGGPTGHVRVYALERMVSETGPASSGGAISSSSQWSGAIATFKAEAAASLSLGGASAGNYTLTGASGAVEITAKPLTVTAEDQSKTYGTILEFGPGSMAFAAAGLVADETIGTVTLSCEGGAAGAEAGAYPITPSAATGGTFDAGNYQIAYVDGTLAVIKSTPSVTEWPTASPIVLGDSLSLSELSGGAASVDGRFAFTDPETAPDTGGTYAASVTFMPEDDVNYATVKANVDVVVQVTVTFAANGGTDPEPASTPVTVGETYGDLAATSRAGYVFLGWFTAAGGGTAVSSETVVTEAGHHTLYARWITVYDDWAGEEAAFEEDSSGDGIASGLAWVLGAGNPGDDARGLLPTLNRGTTGAGEPAVLRFTYRRAAAARDDPNTSIGAVYSTDLVSWTEADDEVDGIDIIEEIDGFGPGIDKVEVRVSESLAEAGRLFIRLRVERTDP